MPTFYSYTENGVVYSFDDVFVPADAFRQGNLWTWGLNSTGQLGDNTTTTRSTPVTTFAGGTNWKQVASGYQHTAAIKTDGTLWTWGRGTEGQLGDNTTTSKSTPVTTFAGGTNWKQVSSGIVHTSAVKTDGTLWIWGGVLAGFSNLGTNDINQRNTPVTTFVGGSNWKQVSCGGYFTAAIKTDGTLWTWGYNASGQLGTNNTITRSTPVTTFAGGNNWKQVSSTIQKTFGFGHITAIKTDGTLWTWGNNGSGQLGDNTTTSRSTPVTTFAGGTDWKQVSSGQNYTSAIKTDGTLWTWGNGSSGQLGNNTVTQRLTPMTTFAGGNNWKQVSSGGYSASAIKTDGTLWTWGQNNNAQLGDNTTTSRSTPVTTFAGGTNWKQVNRGDLYTSATTYIDDYV